MTTTTSFESQDTESLLYAAANLDSGLFRAVSAVVDGGETVGPGTNYAVTTDSVGAWANSFFTNLGLLSRVERELVSRGVKSDRARKYLEA